MAIDIPSNVRRIGLQVAFWGVLFLLLLTLAANFVNIGQTTQLSAYGDDWNDLSAFREDLNDIGIETHSLVSTPLLLSQIEDPGNTTFVVAGMERDTLSFPQFDEDGFISFSSEDGYTDSEIQAIIEFALQGGTVLVFEDYGYAGGIADALGLKIRGKQVFDTTYAEELDYNFIWMCMQEDPCGMLNGSLDEDTIDYYPYWTDGNLEHPCKLLDGTPLTEESAGLCAHHLVDGTIVFEPDYQILLNNPTALEVIPGRSPPLPQINILAKTSNDATIDSNGDGEIWVGNEITPETPDEWGRFNLSIEVCQARDCDPADSGKVIFVADGSMLINALYDPKGFSEGEYGDVDKAIPDNDNRKWILDIIAESLSAPNSVQPAENAQVIFDESRHPQGGFTNEAYNLIYFLLVYFTSEGLAMLFLFIVLFVIFEAVLLKKNDPEPWRHVFSIIYYGFGDANRYGYYTKSNKIKQVLLSKVRNQNGMTREEFDELQASELQRMIGDDILSAFVFENRNLSMEQMVAIVKRIKAWGRT